MSEVFEKKKAHFRFKMAHDMELLILTMGHVDCFQRGSKSWETIAVSMMAAFPEATELSG